MRTNSVFNWKTWVRIVGVQWDFLGFMGFYGDLWCSWDEDTVIHGDLVIFLKEN